MRSLFFAFLNLGLLNPVLALGLGELHVQSALGQPLKAQVVLLGASLDELDQSCIKARVETIEGNFLARVVVAIRQAGNTKSIFLSSTQSLNEPALKMLIQIQCETQLHREFFILLDPPQLFGVRTSSNFAPLTQEMAVSKPAAAALISHLDDRVRSSRASSGSDKQRTPKSGGLDLLPQLPPRAKPAQGKPLTKDVLKLSDERQVIPNGLKISESLSSPDAQRLTENLEQLRAAQARMAAILRGVDVDQAINANQASGQKTIKNLQAELASLRSQNQLDQAALEESRKNTYSRYALIGVAVLVSLSTALVFMLLNYLLRCKNTSEVSWWEQEQEQEQERQQREAARPPDIDDHLKNVQASYQAPTAARDVPQYEKTGSEPVVASSRADGSSGVHMASTDQQQAADRMRTSTLEETNSSTFNFFSERTNSVKVEEISDVTQEAEFWMSVNDPHRAIEILDAQAHVAHPDSPVPWLYLLDLYRLVKDKQKYDELRARFVVLFNANIPEFDSEPEPESAQQLEDFPHLIERICKLWGGSESIPLLQSLLIDDRDGTRSGFGLAVYRDILMLISLAHALEHPKALVGVASNAWPDVSGGINFDGNADNPRQEPKSGTIEFEAIDFSKLTPPGD